MPVNAKFEADFTDFTRGVESALTQLNRFQSELPGVIAALDQTVMQLGLLNVAALAVGVGIGAFNLTHQIAQMVGWDQALADATARLFGYDKAAEAAAARTDALAAASRIAGRAVTDMGDALAVGRVELERMQRQAAHGVLAEDVLKWRSEIALLQSQGVFEKLKADLDTHYFSVKQLSEQYHISAEAIQFYLTRREAQEAKEKEWAAADEKRSADANKWVTDYITARDKAAAKAIELAQKVRDIELAAASDTRGGFLGLNATMEHTLTLMNEQERAAIRVREEAAKFNREMSKKYGEPATTSNVERMLGPQQADTARDAAKVRDDTLAVIAKLDKLGVDMATQEQMRLKAWFDFSERTIGALPGRGQLPPTPPITINVSGVFDSRTISELTEAISQELMRRSNRQLPAA